MKFRIYLVGTFVIAVFIISCVQSSARKIGVKQANINGISFVASPNKLLQENIIPLKNIHANHASIMPFGFIRNLNHPEVVFNTERQWFGETRVGAKQYINMLHQNNLHVMLKPQIWIWHGEYTGYLKMDTNEDWMTLEESYGDFILDFAKLAQETNVEVFCIGTELEQFIIHRPEFWNRLISEIKKIYKGKLTYAANWDEYKRVPFWKQLDYIGVDAYFPVSEVKTPTVKDSRIGWGSWKKEMEAISDSIDKEILFTEFGYRAINYAGKEPWESDHTIANINLEAQSNLTTALFEEIWNEDWFAGGYLWKWHINHKEVGGEKDNQFTPQNKPVEKIIRSYYFEKN